MAAVALGTALVAGPVADLIAASPSRLSSLAGQTPSGQTGCRVTGKVTTMVAAPARVPNFGQGRNGGAAARGGGAAGRTGGAPTPEAVTAPSQAAPQKVEMVLPGATIVVRQGGRLVVATSTELDGAFAIRFTPGQTFRVTAEMASFASEEKDITLGAVPCDTTLNFNLSLLPRNAPVNATAPAGVVAAAGRSGATGTRGFAQLNVNTDANGEATVAATAVTDQSAELARFLPPGFTVSSANSEAVAVNAGGDAINVDRGVLNDRMGAIGRGEFDPATGQFSEGFGPAGGGAGGDQGFGGPGGPGGGGRGGGPGGPGGFALGGRGGRGQSPFQGSVNYTLGGSALNADSIQPRNGVPTPVSQLPFMQHSYGATFGGPVIIPGLYKDTQRRTSFQLNYSGNHSTNLQDQYATVPTDAMRAGDFSAAGIALIDPLTGKPFANNQIPVSRMNPAALALLQYIPSANVSGTNVQNLHTTGTTLSTSNSLSLRLNQNLTPNLQAGRGGAGGRAGGGGGRGGAAGRGGRGTAINLSVQLQYRGSNNEQFNVIPALAGTAKSTSLSVPVTLTVSKGRTNHNLSVNLTRSTNTTTNGFANALDVAGAAGIRYPDTQDPLNWGVPNLSFSNFNVRPSAANRRTDARFTTSYTFARPIQRHQFRAGAEFRRDLSTSESNGNARGSFTFTGLYTGNGALASRNTGADVADFLLGMPQLATIQVGGETRLKERTFALYVEDNWQKSARMTLNLGLRWEVAMPYVEENGRMANLDVSNGFTGASVVTPGMTGPLSGVVFPSGLLKTDWNNVGPRVGMAYRVARGTILNGSYSITYNAGSYASIARNLVGQPPFAVTATNPGTLAAPLSLQTGLLGGTSSTTNNYGVDPHFGLGMIQTWNLTMVRTFRRVWTATVGYTGTRGTSLDLLRAPNRNPDGTLRIDGVQAFTWESSGGHSLLSLGNISLQRGLARGVRFGASYTLAKSMDNASSLGAGGATVAQNDQDLDAEWALSNFDRRHQFSANLTWELPFGVGRKWLSNGGWLAAVAGEWSMNLTMTAQSGAPFTPRVVGATTSVANGTSGSLRANYSGAPISLSDPTLLQFFDTSVFTIPAVGAFGTSPRNVIIGPGGHVVNATFSRDMRLGGSRALSLQVRANNLFNTIQWTSIDTNLNSNTFGQVTRFAGLRTVTINARVRF